MATDEGFEYGTALLDPDGTLWDFYPESDGGSFEWAKCAAKDWNEEEGESLSTCVVVRRTPPVPAGKWEIAVDLRLKEQRSANGLDPLTAERGTTTPDIRQGEVDA